MTDLRDRLAQVGRADKQMDLALERMKLAGLVTERGKARTDSTYVLAAVRRRPWVHRIGIGGAQRSRGYV